MAAVVLAAAAVFWQCPLLAGPNTVLAQAGDGDPPSFTPQPATEPARAILYEEDPNNPTGAKFPGTVTWRAQRIDIGQDQRDVAVRADIDIPGRGLKLMMWFRRSFVNHSSPTYVIDVRFAVPENFEGKSINSVPGILARVSELARGSPLSALAVRTPEGLFSLELSNLEPMRTKNLQFLQLRSWFDLPWVYATDRRCILQIEKGAAGERAFREAFGEWKPSLGSDLEFGSASEPAEVPISAEGIVDGSFLVAVTSQNSESEARLAYSMLRGRFPYVIGKRRPIIMKFDRADKRTLWRAYVGPFGTADAASQFCGSLKAAGGVCMIVRKQK
ncbi:SPOR domain-containing protein [Bradyrhizobium genosp. A]|uniref:SPOR domain-containing protein n=1 Tax=Bradyrhizobium genosp. A TaxID=83626 RepID=UPI003CEB577F